MEFLIVSISLFLLASILGIILWLFFRRKQVPWANELFAKLMNFINWLTDQTTRKGKF